MITRRFPLLFLRQALRGLRSHPVLLLLNVAGIALGVAVFLAIQIANRSANESFRAGIELVAGRANLEVRGRIDETLFPKIAHIDGVRAATPLVEGAVTLPDHHGEYLRIVGVDPFSGADLRTFELLGADRAGLDLEVWLRDPSAIAVSRDYSERILPKVGNPIRVLANGGVKELRPAFVLEPAVSSGDPRIAALDIGWAQELLGMQGRLTTILLLVAPDRLGAVHDAIRSTVPADVEVESPALRGSQIESMLGAFQLNLTALSLVSVLVGAFLIYNTISASVVRRRTEIGILRSLGATRTEVRLLFVGEAAVSGLVGTAIGAALALPLASALAAPLGRTIRELYILTSVERLYLSPWQFAEALAVGLGAALIASWIPSGEAARVDPARALHPGSGIDPSRKLSPIWLVAGFVSLAIAAVLGWATLRLKIPPMGFACALGVLVGFSLLVPAAIRLCAWALQSSPRYLRVASANFSRAIHRNAVTVAALAAAVSMTISISVMIHSFRASVDDWVSAVLVDDLFIGPADLGLKSPLPENALAWLANRSDIKNISERADTTVNFRGQPIGLAVLSGTPRATLRFTGSPGSFDDFLTDGTIIVSEPFANRFNVRRGETIELPSPAGIVSFRIAGVFQDYARSAGFLMIQRKNYERHWSPLPVQSVALQLRDGTNPDTISAGFREKFDTQGEFSIQSNRALRARIFDIFDQTFAVTLVLRAISVLVAAAGATLSLLILAAEREREIGVLRAIGASRAQVAGIFIREAGLIGVVASIVGVASGACLAMVLTWVVNKAFFGWTIQLGYPPGILLSTPLWIIPIAMLAALLPAWRAACVPPARAVRFE